MQRTRIFNPGILGAFLNVLGLAITLASPAFGEEPKAPPGAQNAQKNTQKIPKTPKERALALYESAMAKMLVGLFDRACDEFGESYRLDPLPNTLFALAECEAGAGRNATAARRYEQYIQVFSRMPNEWKALQNGREQVAAQREKELLSQASQVTIALPPGTPSGITVQLDGTTLSMDGDNTIEHLAVDPGDHSLRIGTQSGTLEQRNFSLAYSEHKRLEMWAPMSSPGLSSSGTAVGDVEPDAAEERGRPWAAYVVGGIGLASIAGGLTAAFVPMNLGDYKDAAVGIPIAVGVFGLATSALLFWVDSARPPQPANGPSSSLRPEIFVSAQHGAALGLSGAF